MMIKEWLIGAGIAVLAFLGMLHVVQILPILFLIGLGVLLWVVMDRRNAAAPTARETTARPNISFDEIGGQESAKHELREALDFLRYRDRIQSLGIRPIKGILLTGPPGTGKTLMAKAAATYTDSVFLSASGSEFVEMYVGVGAQRVRDLFRRARALAKRENKDSAIIFVDEIDVVGGKRGQHSHQEYDQTLNQLLTEMDGMSTTQSPFVLVMAATNRPDILDSALLRPGRFDRQIKVDLPDKEGRLHILRILTRNKPLAKDVDLEHIARETYGFSGAQLEALVNEAAIIALRRNEQQVTQEMFRDAVDKVLMGEKTGRRPTDEELRRVAVHELGHAIVSELMRPGTVSHITIAPRGNALGFVRQIPEDDQYLYTKEQLAQQINVALAGCLAEELHYGNRSTGAQNDFVQASSLARTMVRCGLSRLGIVDEEHLPEQILEKEVRHILAEQERITRDILQPYRSDIERFAEHVVREESVDGSEFRRWMQSMQPQVLTSAAVANVTQAIEASPTM
ncbi:Vesicle-fusing ATPase [Alicyclobacillus hesperidum URH17-3-68]|uniref:ATP-dependent metalloprotease FtsH n=2 Tax=Alicyclobacillus hesperidum TaxID=89784 RepID=A0A1H2WSF3_9BACL|nr:Vesicle-fusing ATPase [Alicyclobacillus hesperidum URH17-3-68]KRW91454.1 ATPase [Alicyclobacillus tengchongensis]GLG00767.1 vesicle-fusing ATPase [Alicyclobacillus hesperidum subsp. aegles]GLV12568.1 vesicle-fusing ATPase [Alicyclobacillus hesperidum]SDW83603.1 ATP-dependent metalloprotease FtsH [Alicyclobacillus hesperidum]